MTDLHDVTANTPTLIASAAAGITALGYGVMKAVRQFSATRRENASDDGATTSYTLLINENKRLAAQLTAVSVAVNAALTDKIDLLNRVGDLERKLRGMAGLEQENIDLRAEIAEIREENHDLRDKVYSLQLQMEAKK